jgi:hypothetical protein
MYYRKALKAAGFDPAAIKDAGIEDEFTLHITAKELKGSQIGHPMKCAGAKACRQQTHASFAWVGASMAILGFPNGRLIRYHHNGQLPQKQDQGMFAVGDYEFRHIKPCHKTAARKLRRDMRREGEVPYNHKDQGGLRAGITFEPSLAAQMRRGWEVRLARAKRKKKGQEHPELPL